MKDEQNPEEEELDEEEPEEDEESTEESEGEEEGSTGEEEGKEGDDTPEKITIDGVEYTPDQVKELQTKAKGYDALLPDYTIKSQELSKLQKSNSGEKPEAQEKAPYEDPNWQPKDMKELGAAIKMAEDRGHQRALADLQRREEVANEAKQQVDDFVAEVKKSDKDFDEDDFFQYAVRHKFPINTVEDLQAVHSAYSDTQSARTEGEKRARTNKEKRGDDKVNKPGSGGEKGPDFSDIGGSIMDRAMAGLERVKGK